MPRTTKNSKSIPQVQWKKVKKNPVHMKSPKAQAKNKTQKSFFQPSQVRAVPNMFMPYIEGSKNGLDSK